MTHPVRRSRTASRRNPAQGRPTQARTARIAPVRQAQSRQSELERALDAALAAPGPAPATFAELGLPEPLVAELTRSGRAEPFAIQARTLPDGLAGRDVLGRAQTGSGKTLAFALPMLARLSAAGRPRGFRAPRGLVLVPTRELAQQVADEMDPLARAVGLRVVTVYGGAPIGRQIDRVSRGVDVIVATPGRLIDLLDRQVCTLAEIEITVLDEADYMADLGFLPAVTRILGETPTRGQRLLFSATLDRGVDRLVRSHLDDPAIHAVAPAAAPVEAMDHRVFTVRAEDKLAVTAEVAARPGRTLVFVRTKRGADRLAQQLGRAGVDAAAIHGNLSQNARQRSLDGFAAGSPRVLVATDVAARGIHVDGVDLVVHYDLPADHKDYLHRSGRTARAGESGTVLTLAHREDQRAVAGLHGQAGVSATATSVVPGHQAVRELAESGTPIPPRPRAAQPARSAPDGGRPERGRPGYGRSAGRRRPRPQSGGRQRSGPRTERVRDAAA
jgi:superfamily II DNA/RNA helicase